ncbi:MAG: hypothetical protein IH988_01735 [Planctomycetes bacterium]|nr:hypothetical protein [Planctomycetota bacterium]
MVSQIWRAEYSGAKGPLGDELGLRGQVELEASGGVTLEQVGALADTGVERIAVGALTHSAPALDLALEPV